MSARHDRRRRDLSRTARPTLEGLERRELLFAAEGGLWAHPGRITFSFVPDGTSVGGTPSSLFQSMNSNPNAANWVAAFCNAAVIWQQVTGINLEPVPDDGAALGSGPDQQGDPNHGDIRIAGVPMSPNTLATAYAPPPLNGGDLAGDVVFNTTEPWTTNGNSNGAFDLETVAIHELGHALGLAHSALTNAAMYTYYNTTKQALTADDSLGVQTLYGVQPLDPYSNLPATAYNITGQLNSQGQLTQVMPGPQRTALWNNGDWFYVQAPATTSGTLTVSMQSTGFSMLQPDVAVVNGPFTQLLGETASPYYNSTATVTVTGVTPGAGFYIRCGSSTTLPGHGAYALQLNFGSSQQAVAHPALNTIADQPSQNPGASSGDSTGGAAAGALVDVPGRIRLGGLAGFGDFLKVNPAFGWHRPSHTFGGHPGLQQQSAHAPKAHPHAH